MALRAAAKAAGEAESFAAGVAREAALMAPLLRCV
jgi:hypothetical protein